MSRITGTLLGLTIVALSSSPARAAPPGWPTGKQAPEPDPVLAPGDIKSGAAGFTLGKDASKLPVASGTITKAGEMFMVDLTFKDAKQTSNNVAAGEGKVLRLGFAANGPGPALMITMLVAKSERVLSLYRSRPPVAVAGMPASAGGKCTITVTKIDAKVVEGTASCPSGMVDLDGVASPAISDVTFKAVAL